MTDKRAAGGVAPVCLETPQPGDFVCVPVHGAVGLGIEVGEFLAAKLQRQPAELKPYDHAEVYVGQPDKAGPHGYTYSAYPRKAGETGKRPLACPPQELPGSLWSSGLYDPTDAQRSKIVAWCEAHPEVRYAFADYAEIAAHALRIPVPGLKDAIEDDKSFICSQYVDASWAASGVHLFNDGRWPGYVTPWDLAALLLARRGSRRGS